MIKAPLIGIILTTVCTPAWAADGTQGLPDWIAIHGQGTFTLQGTPGFSSPYRGTNSLTPDQRKETIDVTLYVGVQPWKGGELWVNPEIDQGFGLSDTLGVAGFPSAEAYKVGKKHPYFRLQRLFFRQTLDLGGDAQKAEGDQNKFAASPTANRLVLSIGKFGVGDVFDTNKYAHDPRADFLNWAIVDAGSFDYAADAWGYSTGVAAEWYQGPWTLRLGAFNLSKIPNGETLEKSFGQFQLDAEIEHRHTIAGRDGAVRVTVFRNRGQFGRFDDALALAAATGQRPTPRWCAGVRRAWAPTSMWNKPSPKSSASFCEPASPTAKSSLTTLRTSIARFPQVSHSMEKVGIVMATRSVLPQSSTASAASMNAISTLADWVCWSATAS
jgi:high affinity Mn2+ porin